MDRRQRKTRQAIFSAFIELLSKKEYSQITVAEILEKADVGRATFYAHFETKDYLLKEFCEDLFCHLFDAVSDNEKEHAHIFNCDSKDNVFLHLFSHLQKNDNNLLRLLSCANNQLFLQYFKSNLYNLVERELDKTGDNNEQDLPKSYRVNVICACFTETVNWWIENGKKQTPSQLTDYFYKVAKIKK